MSQTGIPFLFMRGGTSRGPYMLRKDLPVDQDVLSKVLVAITGSGHPINIDGIGGGNAVTTKVAMLSTSDDDWADVDYHFAQVGVEDGLVDYKPTCGNILVGVGPAAIEMGLVPVAGDVTEVKVRAVNTGARIAQRVQTPGGRVAYEGDARIDGVPGTAAPIGLMFRDVVGGATGHLFPTGNRTDILDGIAVSCMDVAMPMVITRASDFELSGYESAAELDENRAFFDRMEAVRRKAGELMGMGDISASVTPKFAVLAPPKSGGSAAVRYFMPFKTHPTLAVTGSQCISACLLCPGTVGEGLMEPPTGSPVDLSLEHPMGLLDVSVDFHLDGDVFDIRSAGLQRTARKLASGEVFVPASIWAGN
ncbi:MAG: 4-oxalomesaconate tautomerase [Pseudomonadota bacterium]